MDSAAVAAVVEEVVAVPVVVAAELEAVVGAASAVVVEVAPAHQSVAQVAVEPAQVWGADTETWAAVDAQTWVVVDGPTWVVGAVVRPWAVGAVAPISAPAGQTSEVAIAQDLVEVAQLPVVAIVQTLAAATGPAWVVVTARGSGAAIDQELVMGIGPGSEMAIVRGSVVGYRG